MRRLSIVVSVVVCALAAPSVAGAATFSEQASGSYAFSGTSVDGSGPISGTTPIASGSVTFSFDCGTGSGEATFTAAGGDSISLTFSGFSCGSQSSSGPFTITGGTGAYAGAGGSGTVQASNNLGGAFSLDAEGSYSIQPQHTLTVGKSGPGSGRVTSSPARIDCGSTCSAQFNEGASVTLTAAPASGSTFAGWTGCDSVTDNQCAVTLSSDRNVTASFATLPQRTLTVEKSGSGGGTVTSSPAGIECGSTCSAQFSEGTWVTLTAAPASASTFAGWTGCDIVNGSECTVQVSADTSVTASFAKIPRTLTVGKSGSGGGTVFSSPAGIDCGSTCSAQFDDGTSVTLTPAPASGSTFAGWTGCDSTTGNQCTVTLSAARSVTASFAPAQAATSDTSPTTTTTTTSNPDQTQPQNPSPGVAAQQASDPLAKLSAAVSPTVASALANVSRALAREKVGQLLQSGAFLASLGFTPGQFVSGSSLDAVVKLFSTGAKARSAATRGRVVLATGRRIATKSGRITIKVKLTPAGRKLLKAAKKAHRGLTAFLQVQVTPRLDGRTGRAVSRSKSVKLKP